MTSLPGLGDDNSEEDKGARNSSSCDVEVDSTTEAEAGKTSPSSGTRTTRVTTQQSFVDDP